MTAESSSGSQEMKNLPPPGAEPLLTLRALSPTARPGDHGRMDTSLVIAQIGTLVGVGLGVWLTARYQRDLTRRSKLEELRREQRLKCAQILAAHRQFRRYIQISDSVIVTEVPVSDRPDRPTFLARGAERQWEVYEQALADFDVLIEDEGVRNAHAVMRQSLLKVIRARAIHAPGAVPDSVVEPAADAERSFAAQVRHAFPG